jgi:hypothetical protein
MYLVSACCAALYGCGDDTTDTANTTNTTATSSSGGAEICNIMTGPPTGSCTAGAECSFSDGGCNFDSYCKEGMWALVRSCAGAECPRDGLTSGDACTTEDAECLYEEAGACVASLQCDGDVWSDSGC